MMNFFAKYAEANLLKRAASAAILIFIVLYINYIGGFWFKLLIVAVLTLAIKEGIYVIGSNKKISDRKKCDLWLFLGLIYLVFATVTLLCIRELNNGMMAVYFLFSLVWITDITAYFAGIAIGGPKLCPKISPKKTLSGAGVALLFAGVIGVLFSYLLCGGFYLEFLLHSLLLSLVAQLGDIFESYFKRSFNVKDTGAIIPGHGEILDRIDSLLSVSIFYWVISDYYLKHLFISS